MHFIWFIIVGAIVGALGRLFHPGSDPMGWLLTIAIGIVSLLVAALISSGWLAFIIGVIVAVILVALVGRLYARPRPHPREGLGRFRLEGLTAAREPPLGREAPIRVAPDVRLDAEAFVLDLVEVETARLALPLRAAAGRGRAQPRRPADCSSPCEISNSRRSLTAA